MCLYTTADLDLLRGLPITRLHFNTLELGSDAILESLHELPIADLWCDRCHWVTNASLEHVAALPLTSLSLRNTVGITDYGLEHLTKATLLTSLDLSHGPNLTKSGIRNLINALPHLFSCRFET